VSDLVICIVNYRTPELTLRCLAAVAEERALLPGIKAVVADAYSGDDSAKILAAALAHPDYLGWAEFLPLPLNGGFGWANNQIMLRLLQSENPPAFFHLLNPDATIRLGAVKALYDRMLGDGGCGAVGSQLIEPDGTPQASAFRDFRIRNELARGAHTHALLRLLGGKSIVMPPGEQAHPADWVTGASVVLRSAALREAGLFDDSFFLYFEETELMSRLRKAGWSVWHEPASKVEHEGSVSTQLARDERELARRGRPLYWYESQKRLMFRTMAPFRAWAALLAWLIGRGFFILRLITGTKRGRVGIRNETRDTIKVWFRRSRLDRKAHGVRWDSPVGLPPAWMRAQ
jgi:GT2 family glycosyltransferase